MVVAAVLVVEALVVEALVAEVFSLAAVAFLVVAVISVRSSLVDEPADSGSTVFFVVVFLVVVFLSVVDLAAALRPPFLAVAAFASSISTAMSIVTLSSVSPSGSDAFTFPCLI